MILKTVISAVTFFATLPWALLGLVGGEVGAQTLQADFGFGESTVSLVACYKGKSLFATEIKRAVWNKSIKGSDSKNWDSAAIKENAKECINEIIKAVQSMSKNNVGAIIILSNSNIPTAILDSGVAINSDISSALIESVFFPKTPLHDGAMVINGTKVQAAGCFLPLSQEINLPKDLGTRHRAGIGITETINVTAIIVSEETGVISIASGGKLKRYADTDMLRNTLKSFYWQDMIN